jgi:hypothetical protein
MFVNLKMLKTSLNKPLQSSVVLITSLTVLLETFWHHSKIFPTMLLKLSLRLIYLVREIWRRLEGQKEKLNIYVCMVRYLQLNKGLC